MGGGVSLGIFSGAALSEAIKLAVLYGKYREEGTWHRYNRVVIDVFSGASAGAMSLAAMLRTLVHRTDEQERRAERNLRKVLKQEYGGSALEDFEDLPEEKREALIAAQAVQAVQESVWGDKVDIYRLLGQSPDGKSRDLRHAGGIFDRRAVDEIARDTISFPDGVDLGGRVLLANRVLFACTLANLTPLVYDARSDLNTVKETGFAGLADALTSRAHQDIRIFDLNFSEVGPQMTSKQSRYPQRWCRYHAAGEAEGRIGDLHKQKTWRKIARTAVAAGAFPFAFDPVVLERSDYEYGDLWPEELAEQDIEEYPFSFVDGGTFNNEPIREAFRLSAVIDAQNTDQDYDRRVIFVDPLVGSSEVSFQIPIHQQYDHQDPNFFGALDGTDLYRRSTLDRLQSHVGTVVTALLNQARVVEEDKVSRVRKRFEIRDQIRAYVQDVLTQTPSLEQLRDLKEFCEDLLEEDTGNLTIPAGTLTIRGELKRVLSEEAGSPGLDRLQGQVQSFLDTLEAGRLPDESTLWLRALVFVAIDLVMNLEGKRPGHRVIAVAPLDVEEPEEETDPVETEPYELPGARLMGFGGFMSEGVADRYHVRLARHCTWQFLRLCDLIPPDAPAPTEPRWTEQKERQFQKNFERGLSSLRSRIEAFIEDSHLLNLSFLNSPVQSLIARFAGKVVQQYRDRGPDRSRHEFRIKVPDKSFEIEGRPNRRPVRTPLGDDQHLIFYGKYGPRSDEDSTPEWKIQFIQEKQQNEQRIRIDRSGTEFCHIFLPSLPARIKKSKLLPDPIFYVEITEDDEGAELDPERWKVLLPPPEYSFPGR